MDKFLRLALSLSIVALGATQAEAYTSRTKGAAVTVSGSGVTATSSLTVSVVAQGTADTAATLSFGTGTNALRDSDEALKIAVDTNLAANRVIIYTDNLNGTASPQFCADTALGNDGGGLVGVGTDPAICSLTVPLLWAINDTNVNHAFTTATVGDDEVYITDLAHVASYVDGAIFAATAADKQKLDVMAMRNCTTGTLIPGIDNTGTANDPLRYPQFFGVAGADSDLCNASGAAVTIDPDGAGAATAVTFQSCAAAPCAADTKVSFAEELSKNIAVVMFGCSGTSCNAPNLATATPTDTVTLTSPVYTAVAGDFRAALGGISYATSTLTVELVTQ